MPDRIHESDNYQRTSQRTNPVETLNALAKRKSVRTLIYNRPTMIDLDAHATFAAKYVGMIADTYVCTFPLGLGIYSLCNVYRGENSVPDLYKILEEQAASFQKILDVESPDDQPGRLFRYLTGPKGTSDRIPGDLGLKVCCKLSRLSFGPAQCAI